MVIDLTIGKKTQPPSQARLGAHTLEDTDAIESATCVYSLASDKEEEGEEHILDLLAVREIIAPYWYLY